MEKCERFGLVLTPAEKFIAKQRAKDEGLSIAAYLRRLIRKDASTTGQWPPTSIIPTKQEIITNGTTNG